VLEKLTISDANSKTKHGPVIMNRLEGGNLALALCLLAGCASGPHEIRLEPPTVDVESLRVENDTVYFRVLMHNRNDHELFIESAAMAMRIDAAGLFDSAWQLDLDIAPRGRELVSLDAPAMPIAAELLEAIQGSPGASVQFALSGKIVIEGQGDAELEREGFLYPVPGQPGQFR